MADTKIPAKRINLELTDEQVQELVEVLSQYFVLKTQTANTQSEENNQ